MKRIKDKGFMSCLCECARNVIKGNVKVTPTQRKAIVKRKKLFKKFVLKKTSLKNKKKIVQTGGFIGALFGPIAALLGGLLAG